MGLTAWPHAGGGGNDDGQRRRRLVIVVTVLVIAVGMAAAAAAMTVSAPTATVAPDAGTAVTMQDSLRLDATYYPGNGSVVITYEDSTRAVTPVAVEVLGMRESYRVPFEGPEFSTVVGFASVPKYGWAVNPVVVEVDHPVFGYIQLKTEIHEAGQPAPRVIYAGR